MLPLSQFLKTVDKNAGVLLNPSRWQRYHVPVPTSMRIDQVFKHY